MNPVYFETLFASDSDWCDVPSSFAIITAHATTGQSWPADKNERADAALEQKLRERETWVRRLTGFSPTTSHAEPGWAVAVEFETACDIGQAFEQDAIYFVRDDQLFVSHCDHRRSLISVGDFRSRLRSS
ncbi:DUF3293 domain-containing protein [Roseiconus nitratireducens]|uniref:DUF3293 domain-containing protein n=1 Tax=Roseiconus nitratireducens TaxID=2605748 RepID=A0A5M6CUY6_9BACT|nr:DUF3293 domain-containing protein [Roseiconus nitratireducens]KAA5539011.1 DUF3293 domain-containing protein [Roseiconus nitratireducens]